MNRELVENILGVIKTSTDKAVIFKALIKLRTDLVKDLDGINLFREAGGVAICVRLLHRPYEKILEVVLSILGNCCTDELCCKQAFQAKCVSPLATILKSIPNTVIQCRACRLIGNLAKSDCVQLLATHCTIIVQSICQIIVDTTDVLSRIMGFRACRFLLANPQCLKHFLQANGFTTMLRILAAVMKNDDAEPLPLEEQVTLGLKKTQHREKYFEEVARNLECVRSDIFDHEVLKNSTSATSIYAIPKEKAALDLACEILKCLLVMSELQIILPIWEALGRSNCTFAPIVFFVTEENKHRSVALKILSNFAKNRGAFYMLSSSDAIVAACELLVSTSSSMEQKPLSESEKRHCINVISMLSPDACNRSKIRRSGALRKLLKLLRESGSQTEIASILYLLNYFQYDDMSMDLILREGLITVLIKELNAYLSGDDDYHKRRREERQQNCKKRKRPDSGSDGGSCKFAKKREEPLLDCDSPSSSPHSYASPASPCSSRGMSPLGSNPFKWDGDGDSDDETYSPVCSDEDDDETAADASEATSNHGPSDRTSGANNAINASRSDYSDIMRLLEIAARSEALEDNILLDKEDDDDISQDVPGPKLPQGINNSTIDIIENLLFRATLLVNKRGELGKPETLRTLIKAVNLFGAQNNFAGSLTNVLLESQFFAAVVKQGITHQLFQLTKIEEMRKDGFAFLETLTCVGESNYGKDELALLLRSDDEFAQTRAAIAVAYIVKNQKLLYQFLNAGNALSLLFNVILRKNRDELTIEAVDALTAMCQHTLNIAVPQIDAEKQDDTFDSYTEMATLAADEGDMCFMVHETPAVSSGNIVDNKNNQPVDDDKNSSTAPPAVRVTFSKQMLCDASEVFNTMLNSNFREGNEGAIHLTGYSVSGLRYFLDLVVRLAQHRKFSIPPPRDYGLLLEAFDMSRVYIIPAMEEFVLQLLICMLDASNCLQVLQWAMKNYHAELIETAINYYLCSPLTADAKVQLFRRADDSTYATEWFQMLFDAVFERCRNGI